MTDATTPRRVDNRRRIEKALRRFQNGQVLPEDMRLFCDPEVMSCCTREQGERWLDAFEPLMYANLEWLRWCSI